MAWWVELWEGELLQGGLLSLDVEQAAGLLRGGEKNDLKLSVS